MLIIIKHTGRLFIGITISLMMILLTATCHRTAETERKSAEEKEKIRHSSSPDLPPGSMNILFILCDQLRADFLDYGNVRDIAPNIHEIAQNGLVFEKAYAVMPVCVAARLCLLTGMHPTTCPNPIPADVPILPGILLKYGYDTYAVGKMHMNPPRGPYGFNRLMLAEDTEQGMFLDDYHPWLANKGYCEWTHGLDNADIASTVNSLPEDVTSTHWIGDHAVDYLTARAADNKPFYAVVSFVKPHPPYDPSSPWASRFKPEDMKEPFATDRPFESYPQAVREYSDAFGFRDFMKVGTIQEIRAHYWGLVAQIDNEVGKIMKELEQTGLDKKTLIVFSSDHGDFLGDHNLFMKFFSYESSSHIPFLICGPGIRSRRVSIPVSHLDYMPTFLDYLDLPVPESCQGTSVFTLMEEGEREGVLISSAVEQSYTWITQRYKYTYWLTGEEEMYDLAEDPFEVCNKVLIDTIKAAELRNSLIAALEELDSRRHPEAKPLLQQGQLIKRSFNTRVPRQLRKTFKAHRLPPDYGK